MVSNTSAASARVEILTPPRRTRCPQGSLSLFFDCKRAVFDEVAHPAEAEPLPERPHGVADHRRVGARPHCGRTWQVKHRADLAEVVTGSRLLHQLLTGACPFP